MQIKHTCKDCIHLKICNDYVHLVGREDKVACPDYKSTEDVVPRAEVEKARQVGFELGKTDNIYGHSVDKMAKKIEELSIELEQAKQEVAREILGNIKIYIRKIYDDYSYRLVDFENDIDRLGKKYIGD